EAPAIPARSIATDVEGIGEELDAPRVAIQGLGDEPAEAIQAPVGTEGIEERGDVPAQSEGGPRLTERHPRARDELEEEPVRAEHGTRIPRRLAAGPGRGGRGEPTEPGDERNEDPRAPTHALRVSETLVSCTGRRPCEALGVLEGPCPDLLLRRCATLGPRRVRPGRRDVASVVLVRSLLQGSIHAPFVTPSAARRQRRSWPGIVRLRVEPIGPRRP